MELVAYEDCLSLKYSDMSDGDIERQGTSFTVDLDLVNGARTEVELVVRPGPEEIYEILEILLDNSLVEEFLDDIADLGWYVFPAGRRRIELPPVVASWEDEGVVIAACQAAKYGGAPAAFQQQMRHFKDADTADPDRVLCWWPESTTWSMMEALAPDMERPNVTTYYHAFYTFTEWFARRDLAHTPPGARAAEFARHLRQIRTTLLWHRRRGRSVHLTEGNAQIAERLFQDMGLDPDDPGSWSSVATEFEPMPDVLLETVHPCGPTAVLGRPANVTAVFSLLSHLPELAPSLDCVGAALFAGRTNIVNLFAWCNPLVGSGAFEKAMDLLMAEFDRYNVRETTVVEGMLPFETCGDCGNMTLRAPDGFTGAGVPVRVETKPGRNDPCPCGSGKKYKKCCGRP